MCYKTSNGAPAKGASLDVGNLLGHSDRLRTKSSRALFLFCAQHTSLERRHRSLPVYENSASDWLRYVGLTAVYPGDTSRIHLSLGVACGFCKSWARPSMKL